MLKADLHLHTSADLQDNISYDAKKLIDIASTNGFDVLSITLHETLYHDNSITRYAEKKGILLIPGIELRFDKADVLAYNLTPQEAKKVKSFKDLKELKKKKKDNILIIAPHPYYIMDNCLKDKLIEHIDLFDAIEYSHFYSFFMNFPNKKAVKVAKKFNKTIVGSSDCHFLSQFNHTYTLIDSEKSILSIFDAIRKGKVQLVTRPLSLVRFIFISLWASTFYIRRIFTRR